MKSSLKQFAVVLGAWTLVAVADGLASYCYGLSTGQAPALWTVFRRPLTEQWIWAALTPVVFMLTTRFPLAPPHLARALAVHLVGFLALSLFHCALAEMVGSPLGFRPAGYAGSLLKLRFLEEVYSDIWMYWPLVCIRTLMASNAQARRREAEASRLEALLVTAQLASLRAQIQPHFLFNTLHSITALVRTDPLAAQDLIADLAQILRASFADSAMQQTSLQRELQLVDCYLRIQQRRFGDRLRCVYRIAPETLEASVPSLALQSLVENAVIHGIAPLTRPGTITLSAQCVAGRLVLQVEDDGAGLPAPFEAGLGTANARMRLQLIYGNDQALDLTGAPGHGTVASITIPYQVIDQVAGDRAERDEDTHAHRGRRAARAA
jgi:two-component system, LytTR family, sensor kinase